MDFKEEITSDVFEKVQLEKDLFQKQQNNRKIDSLMNIFSL